MRGELLQHIYDDLYMQRIKTPCEADWQHRILKYHSVVGAEAGDKFVNLRLHDGDRPGEDDVEMTFDAVIIATGYSHDAHETLLEPIRHLTASGSDFAVGRDYRVQMREGNVSEDAGVWLQGCNEGTHGVRDHFLTRDIIPIQIVYILDCLADSV